MSSTPAHWTSKDGVHLQPDGALLSEFQELVSATWRIKYTRDRKKSDTGGRVPTGARVTNVLRVENHDKFNSYLLCRSELKERRGSVERFPVCTDTLLEHPSETNLNEMYLFHGTNPMAADSIARTGFKLDLAGSAVGTMFGRGIYLAEHCSKSDEYAKEGDGVFTGQCALLVCRALAGRVYVTPDKGDHSGKVLSGEFDSVCGDRLAAVGTFREMVFFNADAVYVEFIVLYSRLYEVKHDETDVAPKAASPASTVLATMGARLAALTTAESASPKAVASPASEPGVRSSKREERRARRAVAKAAATPAAAEPVVDEAVAPAAPKSATDLAAAPEASVVTRRFNEHWTGSSWCHPVTGRELKLTVEDAVSFCSEPVKQSDGKQSITFMPRSPGTYIGVALRADPLGMGSVRFYQSGRVYVNGDKVEDAFKYTHREHITLELESGVLTFIKRNKRGEETEKAQYHGVVDGVHFAVGVGKVKNGTFEIVG